MGIKDIFKKKPKIKEVSAEDLVAQTQAVVETPEQRRERQIQQYMEQLKQAAIQRYGYDEVRATKWAWEQVEKKTDKMRDRGTLLACKVCKKGGANAKSGALIKTADGKYRHENCSE